MTIGIFRLLDRTTPQVLVKKWLVSDFFKTMNRISHVKTSSNGSYELKVSIRPPIQDCDDYATKAQLIFFLNWRLWLEKIVILTKMLANNGKFSVFLFLLFFRIFKPAVHHLSLLAPQKTLLDIKWFLTCRMPFAAASRACMT